MGNRSDNSNPGPVSPHKTGFLSSRNSKFFIGGVVIVLALGALMFNSMRSTTVYYITVSELLGKAVNAQTEDVRVAAKVVDGSIKWDTATSVGTFEVIDETGAKMPVTYQGIMPDAFTNGSDVVVEGKLDNGTFKAHTLLAKCPSKYESAE